MNLEEMRSFDYFRGRTVPQLCGYFESEFWNRFVLRTAFHEPAIRHAIVALGSLHERFEASDPLISRSNSQKVDGGFALEQYNRAIRYLLKPITESGRQALDVALTACALFTCFEVSRSYGVGEMLTFYKTLRGHHGSAFSHVKNGISMLRELQAGMGPKLKPLKTLASSETPMVPYATFQVMFARFDCQSIRLGEDNGPFDYAAASYTEPGFCDCLERFDSILQARNSLEHLERVCYEFFQKYLDELVMSTVSQAVRRQLLDELNQWFNVFAEFLRIRASQLSAMSIQASRFLQTRYLVLKDMLSVTNFFNEMSWDEHIDLYARITELTAQIVADPTYRNKLNGVSVPVFSLDNGIVGPLFHVVRRCRDPRIRRKALSLWRATPRQEGVWDGMLALQVAEKIMLVEEEGLGEVQCCTDIPCEARIASLAVRMHSEEKRANVCFSKIWLLQDVLQRNPRGIIQEVLEW